MTTFVTLLFQSFRTRFIVAALTLIALMSTDTVVAQTIAVTAVSTSAVCSGSTVTITFTATSGNGSRRFDANTVFAAYLSSSTGAAPYTLLGSFSASGYSFGDNFSVNAGLVRTLTIPAGTAAGTSYKITVGAISPSVIATVGAGASSAFTVGTAVTGGTVSGSQTICSGSQPSAITLSGNTGNIVKWQKSAAADFSQATDINVTAATLSGTAIGNLTSTTYIRAVVQGTCSSAFSTSCVISMNANSTWTGAVSNVWNDAANWSCGIPSASTHVNIGAGTTMPQISGNVFAESVTVAASASVVVTAGSNLTVINAVTVEATGMMTLANNANLVQINNVANTGTIIVKRNSSALKRQDYTLWSSPVAGQKLLPFSPLTLTNRFYNYTTATNLYSTVADPANTVFEAGKGYLVRVPNNHPTWAAVWAGQFTGVPNNGIYNVAMTDAGAGKRFNLVGNPYPSPISAAAFVAHNAQNITGTLYFWRKTNNASSPSYCTWNSLGFVNNGESQVSDPNGMIQTGQGFFVEAKAGATNVVFNNAQRRANNNNQFFRSADESEAGNIWINVTSDAGAFSQTLVGYTDGATTGFDEQFDGKYINDGVIALTSQIDGEKYVIQGRTLPFDAADTVALNFNATVAGNFTIGLDHTDGLFDGAQPVYLKDNTTGIMHDLKAGSYAFSADAGTFPNRFEIVYQTVLGVGPVNQADDAVIWKNGGNINVNAGLSVIENIEVYDLNGRRLYEAKAVNAQEASFRVDAQDQALIVKATFSDDSVLTKKIVN
jgi:hypothetical protein